MTIPRLVIAGTQTGVGKTTVTLALLAAFRERGRNVQPFKVGPDFIDPGHHRLACGRTSRNLDSWMVGEVLSRDIFWRATRDADLAIVEGMMGLFDGTSPVNDVGSTAEMAKLLAAPVLLVVDGRAMARSVAAMVLGYKQFDSAVRIGGVVLNRISHVGHYELLKAAIEKEIGVDVMGYLPSNPDVTIPDRHLGLHMADDDSDPAMYRRLGQMAASNVNLDLVDRCAQSAAAWSHEILSLGTGVVTKPRPMKIGVAGDAAFCFYYQDNLEALQNAGAELRWFSPLHDRRIPEVDVLYLGGGYPELYARVLQDNHDMRSSIARFAGVGGGIFAECGGMMYLCRAIIDFEGQAYDMVGIIPAEAVMSERQIVMGYRHVMVSTVDKGEEMPLFAVRGHEFHYSTLRSSEHLSYTFQLNDVRGVDKGPDGIRIGNVLGSYTHLYFARDPEFLEIFWKLGRCEWTKRG
ncbi:MAG: cobyrinate a,c-diamide synthase [Nitrospirales bacterium]